VLQYVKILKVSLARVKISFGAEVAALPLPSISGSFSIS